MAIKRHFSNSHGDSVKTDLEYFQQTKTRILSDLTICEQNRSLYRRFFEYMENRLKRLNGLTALDEGNARTLLKYAFKLGNIERWFKAKPLVELTAEDIQSVYDGLEDGTIVNSNGKRFKFRVDYYNKIFKSKLFELAGKKEIACSIIDIVIYERNEVRFVREAGVRKILDRLFLKTHRLLTWLAFDVGENINSLLKLRKRDFERLTNSTTGEPEYRVQLRKRILKRSRTSRSVITNFRESANLLDEHLATLQPDDLLFSFGYRGANKFLTRAVEESGVKCEPHGENVTWKDLRSGMACHLLMLGWSTEEVKARLGHAPSSKEIDKYVNYLALDQHAAKSRLGQIELSTLQRQLQESEQRGALQAQRLRETESRVDVLQSFIGKVASVLSIDPSAQDLETAIREKLHLALTLDAQNGVELSPIAQDEAESSLEIVVAHSL